LEEEERAREREKLKEYYLRVFMTSEARERLSNIKMVRPELASMVEEQILQLALSNKLDHPITDEELKSILLRLQERRREFRIRF
jgi:programmed cell death protein 5